VGREGLDDETDEPDVGVDMTRRRERDHNACCQGERRMTPWVRETGEEGKAWDGERESRL
jgi:hypothetical protein